MTYLRRAVFALMVLAASAALAQRPQPASIAQGDFEIAGIVVDALSMDPIPGATVLIAPVVNRGATRTASTGADGRFSFTGLARGKYSFAGSSRGYPTQGFEQHEGYSTAIAVGPALDSTHIVFRLQPGGSIRGRILDDENEPVANATIYLFATRTVEGRRSTRRVGGTNSNDLGSFSFAHLPPGTYYIAVQGRPWYASPGAGQYRRILRQQRQQMQLPATGTSYTAIVNANPPDADDADDGTDLLDKVFPLTYYGGATTSAEATAIDLQPGERFTADINVRAVPSLHVRIPSQSPPTPAEPTTDPSEPAKAEAVVRVESIPSANPSVHVQMFQRAFDDTLIPVGGGVAGGANGPELTGMAPGHYLLQISPIGEGRPTTASYQEADITSDMDLPTASTPSASVAGTVQIEGEAPPSTLVLMLVNEEINKRAGVRLKPNGEFRIQEPLIPGKYEVSVGNAEGWYLSSITATGAKVSGRTLIVGPGDTATLNLKISHGLAEVSGTAMRDGKTMSGAMIVLVPRNPGNSTVLFRRDQSDSDGTFTLSGVVPGQYTLLAIQDGWKLTWNDPVVLKRYLAKGEPLQVAPSAKLQSTVNVQDR